MSSKLLLVAILLLVQSCFGNLNETINNDSGSCNENEVYSACDNHGCQNTCAQPDLSTRCDIKPGCYPGCICVNGFLKDVNGKCQPEHLCSCPENEEYSDTGKTICENTCEAPRQSTYCKAKAEPGCGCSIDYLRNKDGRCVLPADCGEGCGGDPMAVFDKCGDPCPVTCNNKDKDRMNCDCITSGGCKCKEGLVKNIFNKCIFPEQCPTCGPNEFFACGSACDTTCATLGDVCPIVNIKCNEMCYCVDGYARDKANVCIPIKQCPPKFTCPKDQVYNPCPLDCPGEKTCQSYLDLVEVICDTDTPRAPCKPKCECKTGLIRKVKDGACVKPEQCCSDPNAEVVACPNPCPGGTCESPNFANCKAPCKIRGCQCKKGYVKDATGKCILLSKCPKPACDKPNEQFYDCVPCVASCQTKNPVCVAACLSGCACKTGYVRTSDTNSTCILEKQCAISKVSPPATVKCGENETYDACPPTCPLEPTCAQLFMVDQPTCSLTKKGCFPGCRCNNGYVRNDNKKCVLPPKCCSDPNAELVDKPNCCPGGTCAQPKRDTGCKKGCPSKLCQCKKGFLQISEDNPKCIPEKECSKHTVKNK